MPSRLVPAVRIYHPKMPQDDCVKTLAGEGTSYKEARTRAACLDEATTEKNISIIPSARNVYETLWPVLKDHDSDDKTEEKATEISSLRVGLRADQ